MLLFLGKGQWKSEANFKKPLSLQEIFEEKV